MMRQLLVKQSSVVRNGSCSAKFRDCYALLQFDFIRIGGACVRTEWARMLNSQHKMDLEQAIEKSHTRVNDIDIFYSSFDLYDVLCCAVCVDVGRQKMDRIKHLHGWPDPARSSKCQSYAIRIFFAHIFYLLLFYIIYRYCTLVKWHIKGAHYLKIAATKKRKLRYFDHVEWMNLWWMPNRMRFPDVTSSITFISFYCQSYFFPTDFVHFSRWPLIFFTRLRARAIFMVCRDILMLMRKQQRRREKRFPSFCIVIKSNPTDWTLAQLYW